MKAWNAIGLMAVIGFTAPLLYAAEPEDNCCEDSAIQTVITLSGGIGFNSDAGASEDFAIGYSQLDYDSNHKTEVRGVWGGSIGAEFPVLPLWALQLGAAYYQSSTFEAEGTLAQGFNPESTDFYDYHYKIIARQVLIEGKLLRLSHEYYRPYVSLGLGAAFNEAKDYTIDYPPSLALTPLYDDHTTTSFTYNVGVGMDVNVTDYLRLGLGYRFTDFGRVKLDHGVYDLFDPTAIPASFEQDHLYVQEILAQITLLI